MADWNVHDEASVNLLHEAGGDWAFYNGGNRWTYGVYLYKAAKQFGMKFRLSWHWNAVGRRPLLRARLPRGRLRLVQRQSRRRADPVGPLRAAARGPGRLPPAAHAGAAGPGEGRHPGGPGRRTGPVRNPGRVQAGRPRIERRGQLRRAARPARCRHRRPAIAQFTVTTRASLPPTVGPECKPSAHFGMQRGARGHSRKCLQGTGMVAIR